MKIKSLVFSLIATGFLSPAQAATPYAGARIGWSYFQAGCESWATGCQRDALGGGVFGGMEINQWLALEGGYTWLGKAKGEYRAGDVDGTMQSADLSAKVTYPVLDPLALYGRVGALHWWGKVDGEGYHYSDRGWDALFATGIEYRLNERWLARLEYQFIDGLGNDRLGQSDHHLTSLGVVYRFAASTPSAPTQTTLPSVPTRVVLAPLSAETLFAFDSATLRDTAVLTPLLNRLLEAPQSRLLITGHTDDRGSQSYNQGLSERRAQAVADWLASQGIASQRLSPRGDGARAPIADNSTEEGRAQNRRVDLQWQP